MAILKVFAFLALAAIAVIFTRGYFSSEEPTVNITEQLQLDIPLPDDQDQTDKSDFSLFTDTIICKAIINAVAGADPEIMTTTDQADKIVVSFKREADGKDLSYGCKKVDDRFYLENTSKFFSQSVIEVVPKVTAPRVDELNLYIFDTSDVGNIVKTYTIDQFE